MADLPTLTMPKLPELIPCITKYCHKTQLRWFLFHSQATKSGGVLALVGLGAAEVTIPIVDASVREVDIRGVFRYDAYW